MAVIGGAALLKAGYSPAHLAALEEVSASVGRNVIVSDTGAEMGAPVLRWQYPIPNPSYDWHKQAGIKGTWRGNIQGWEVYPEGHVQTQFTEKEKIYPPILERQPGETMSFNPFQYATSKGISLGTITTASGEKRTVAIKGYTKKELTEAIKQLEAGQDIKYYKKISKIPVSVVKKAIEQGVPVEKLPTMPLNTKISFSSPIKPLSPLAAFEAKIKKGRLF